MNEKNEQHQRELRMEAWLHVIETCASWSILSRREKDLVQGTFDLGFKAGIKAAKSMAAAENNGCAVPTSHPA